MRGWRFHIVRYPLSVMKEPPFYVSRSVRVMHHPLEKQPLGSTFRLCDSDEQLQLTKAVSYNFPIGSSQNAKAIPFYPNGFQSVVPEPAATSST